MCSMRTGTIQWDANMKRRMERTNLNSGKGIR